MSKLSIVGDCPLFGETVIQGSKNAVLPMMAATLLQEEICILQNVPNIEDVQSAIDILKYLGAKILFCANELIVDTSTITKTRIPHEYMEKMRSSILFMGALLIRCGKAKASKPGGCSIGARPIDLHLDAFEQLGAKIIVEEDEIIVESSKLKPGICKFSFPSVGATENALLIAAKMEGICVLQNVAREPEVMELCWFLEEMGCKIEGIGTSCLIVHGTKNLHGITYQVSSDRIVAGTYLAACVMARGEICLRKCPVVFMRETLRVFSQMGASYTVYQDALRFSMKKRPRAITYLETAPYPKFPTDMQSIVMAVLTIADGNSCICEKIFENRMGVVKSLKMMGAQITNNKTTAKIKGVSHLTSGPVVATDLRSGAALVVAGLGATGTTIIDEYEHIARGYEDIVKDIGQLGGKGWMVE